MDWSADGEESFKLRTCRQNGRWGGWAGVPGTTPCRRSPRWKSFQAPTLSTLSLFVMQLCLWLEEPPMLIRTHQCLFSSNSRKLAIIQNLCIWVSQKNVYKFGGRITGAYGCPEPTIFLALLTSKYSPKLKTMGKCRLWFYNAEFFFVCSGQPYAPVIRPPNL